MPNVKVSIESNCEVWIAGLRKLGADYLAYFTPQNSEQEHDLGPGFYEIVFASSANPSGRIAEFTVSTSDENSISKKVSVDDNGDLIDHFYFGVTENGEVS